MHGLDRFEARKKAAELLEARGLLAKAEPYENNVGFSDRSDVPIEPRLSEQWFLQYPKTKEALAVVRDHLIRFFPSALGKSLRAVAGEHSGLVHQPPGLVGTSDSGVVPEAKSEIRNPKSEIYVGIEPPPDPENWTQDDDTLDTWFSSWLWAYETMDPKTRERNFIRRATLVTAPDIIFFWVARMIIAGLEFKPGKSSND